MRINNWIIIVMKDSLCAVMIFKAIVYSDLIGIKKICAFNNTNLLSGEISPLMMDFTIQKFVGFAPGAPHNENCIHY